MFHTIRCTDCNYDGFTRCRTVAERVSIIFAVFHVARTAKKLRADLCCAPMQAAVDAYGSQDADLWMKYVQSRIKRGKSVGDLYWRASRMLQDPAVFTLKYEALQLADY